MAVARGFALVALLLLLFDAQLADTAEQVRVRAWVRARVRARARARLTLILNLTLTICAIGVGTNGLRKDHLYSDQLCMLRRHKLSPTHMVS